MRIAEELRIAFERAKQVAFDRRHEYLTLEHLLFALLHDPSAAEAIEACAGNLGQLEKDLDIYLEMEVDKIPEDEHREPEHTNAVGKVLFGASSHAASAGHTELTGPIVFCELMREEESFAVYLLQARH